MLEKIHIPIDVFTGILLYYINVIFQQDVKKTLRKRVDNSFHTWIIEEISNKKYIVIENI